MKMKRSSIYSEDKEIIIIIIHASFGVWCQSPGAETVTSHAEGPYSGSLAVLGLEAQASDQHPRALPTSDQEERTEISPQASLTEM